MNKLSKTFLKAASLLLTMLLFQPVNAGDFAVSPMMIDFEGAERSTHDFSFSIFGRSDTKIKLDLFDMSQNETGYMGFVKANLENSESMASWIELNENSLEVRDGETTTIAGRITVPPRAAGTYLVGVMVEEDLPEEQQGGINVQVRYAVVLNMRVAGSRNSRIKSSFAELVAVEQEDGIYLQGMFNNESTTDEWLISQVQIRDEENRLIDRVELKTESAWQREDTASRVFPGARVRVFGKLSEEVETGNYQVLVRNRFASRSQPVYRDTIRLTSTSTSTSTNQNAIAAANISPVELSPPVLPIDVRSNGVSFSTFFLTNNTDEEITIEFPSVFENLEALGVQDFQFYPSSLLIAPLQKSRVVLKQTHVDSIEYGNIVFPATVKSESQLEGLGTLSIATSGGTES